MAGSMASDARRDGLSRAPRNKMTVHAKRLYAALIALLAFAGLAWLVTSGRAIQIDIPLRRAIHQWASPTLTQVMIAVSFVGRPALMPLPGAVCVWLLLQTGRRRQAVWFVITACGAEVVLQLLG